MIYTFQHNRNDYCRQSMVRALLVLNCSYSLKCIENKSKLQTLLIQLFPLVISLHASRSFPAIYTGGRACLKRKAPEPPKQTSSRFLELQFCLQTENSPGTPKDESALLQAGLGRRTLNLAVQFFTIQQILYLFFFNKKIKYDKVSYFFYQYDTEVSTGEKKYIIVEI